MQLSGDRDARTCLYVLLIIDILVLGSAACEFVRDSRKSFKDYEQCRSWGPSCFDNPRVCKVGNSTWALLRSEANEPHLLDRSWSSEVRLESFLCL